MLQCIYKHVILPHAGLFKLVSANHGNHCAMPTVAAINVAYRCKQTGCVQRRCPNIFPSDANLGPRLKLIVEEHALAAQHTSSICC